MSRSFEGGETNAAEFDRISILHWRERILGTCTGAQVDAGAGGPVSKLQMAGDEVCVEVGEEHVPNLQAVAPRFLQIRLDVPLRIDHGCRARLLVANEIRRVREAIQIELFEDHRPSASLDRLISPGARR